ncbi:MAG: hypothetical protein JO360_15625 [Acidobacteria bacterium]|nr:hypothetical protein [Acidobacteriota bacterium]
MRRSLTALLILLVGAALCAAQSGQAQGSAATQPDMVIKLGKASVILPPPEGFAEATSQIESLRRIWEATESSDLDFLASHIPTEDLAKMKRGEPITHPFYTKVSVLRKVREMDISPELFSGIVNSLQQNSGKIFDINGPALKSSVRDANKGLDELLEQDVKLDMSQPVNLGEIEKTQNYYSTLLLIKSRIQIGAEQREAVLLLSVSLLRVRQRVIYLYFSRLFKSEADIEIVKSQTVKWLKQVLRANPD